MNQEALLALRLPRASPEERACFLEEATAFILAYTGRNELPEALASAAVSLAVLCWNQRGQEGMTQYSDGSVSMGLTGLPPEIRMTLDRYRKMTVVW